MRQYTFTENGFTFERVDKKQARKAYNNGLTVRFCPCNLRPGSPFRLDMDMNRAQENCAGLGLVECFPGWCTGYSSYTETLQAIKTAIKAMRDELKSIPTVAQYEKGA